VPFTSAEKAADLLELVAAAAEPNSKESKRAIRASAAMAN
jgi:hypothetical protein